MFRGYLMALPLSVMRQYITDELPPEFAPVATTYLQQVDGYYITLVLEDGTTYYLSKSSKGSTHVIVGVEGPENWFFSTQAMETAREVARRYGCADFAKLAQNDSTREQLLKMAHHFG